MPHSFSQIYIHLVFGAKYRDAGIPHEVRVELYQFMAAILTNLECPTQQLGGTEDHVHVLFSLSRSVSVAKVVEELKSKSSLWMRSRGPGFSDFQWQAGYGAFSVSQSHLHRVMLYIQNQVEHHRKMSFSDECVAIAAKYGIRLKPRYRGAPDNSPG
ncbi:MAG: IS200/IS605 family transposase [Desulfomonilaceae bacterium]